MLLLLELRLAADAVYIGAKIAAVTAYTKWGRAIPIHRQTDGLKSAKIDERTDGRENRHRLVHA